MVFRVRVFSDYAFDYYRLMCDDSNVRCLDMHGADKSGKQCIARTANSGAGWGHAGTYAG